MSIESWVYNRIISSTSINAIISGHCTPNIGTYANIPCVVYSNISQATNKFCRQPIMSIRCVETTQDKCLTLNELLYNRFDNTTATIQEIYSGLRIEGVEIVNNIPSLFDFTNQKWHGVLDIKIFYEK